MQTYPVRASHRAGLTPPALEAVLKTHFGTAAVEGDAVVGSFGAISRLSARAAGRELSVDLTMNPKVPDEVARETIRRYNQFLEAATGYSSKERAKRMRKSAGESGPGA
ncbi:MAG: DUF5611 family protein [Thermoplasmata archaeon]